MPSAETWIKTLDDTLKEWRTQDPTNPTLSREAAEKRLRSLGLSSGEVIRYLSPKSHRK